MEFGFPVQVSSSSCRGCEPALHGEKEELVGKNRKNSNRALRFFWEGGEKESTDAASCLVQSLESRWLSVGESSEATGSFSHNAASCLQVLIKVLAGYAAEMSCCIADRLCSVSLADAKSI